MDDATYGRALGRIIGEGKRFSVTEMDQTVTLPGGGVHPCRLVVVHETGKPDDRGFTFDMMRRAEADEFCAALNWFAP